MSKAMVHMYRANFKPGRMCDDPALLYFGQVVTDDGTVLARASRIYNQWHYEIVGIPGSAIVLEHPAVGDATLGEVFERRHAELTAQVIQALVSIAKAHNAVEPVDTTTVLTIAWRASGAEVRGVFPNAAEARRELLKKCSDQRLSWHGSGQAGCLVDKKGRVRAEYTIGLRSGATDLEG